MSYFQWDHGMSVGLARLDDDHKVLIAIINRLAAAFSDEKQSLSSSDVDSIVQEAMTALLRYTEYHFGREEAVLKAVGYPPLEQHRKEHKRFIRELQELRAEMTSTRDEHKRDRLLLFLKDWLTHHILAEDQAYKDRIHGDPAAHRAAESYTSVDHWTARVG